MKKFGSGLTGAQMRFAREIEAAGLASISQAVKALERGEVEKIVAWKLALAPKPEVAESQNEEPSDDGSSKREEAEQPEPQFTETQSGYLSEETFSTKAAAVNAARGLRVPTDAKQDEYGDWHLYSQWNPATPHTHGGARPGAGRKPDSGKVERREPLYQQGYGAGYQAGNRKSDKQRTEEYIAAMTAPQTWVACTPQRNGAFWVLRVVDRKVVDSIRVDRAIPALDFAGEITLSEKFLGDALGELPEDFYFTTAQAALYAIALRDDSPMTEDKSHAWQWCAPRTR